MLFVAYGYVDIDVVCRMIAHTCVFDAETVRSLLYVTLQHSAAVRTQEEAIAVLRQYMQAGPVVGGGSNNSAPPPASAAAGPTVAAPAVTTAVPGHRPPNPPTVEELLNANVLPHLAQPATKMAYLAHMVGVLLNHVFDPESHASQQYDTLGCLWERHHT